MPVNTTFKIATLAGLAFAVTLPAAAQRTTFEPAIDIRARYEDNIGYVNDDGRSDSSAVLSLDLPVTREWRRGTASFSYSPSVIRQQDESDLDREEHRVGLDLRTQPSQTSEFRFATSFRRSQAQGVTTPFDDDAPFQSDLFLARRTERDLTRARLSYRKEANERWDWRVEASFSDRKYTEIENFDPAAPPAVDVEDRSAYGGAFRFQRSVSRRSKLGARFSHRSFDLTSGDEQANSANLTYSRQLDRNSEFEAAVGAFRSTGEAADGPGLDDERTGFEGGLRYTRSYRTVDLRLDLAHAPSSGGDLSGTSTDTRFGLTLAGPVGRDWDWRASTRYGRRDPSDVARATRETYSVSGTFEREVRDLFGVRFDLRYTDQSNEESSSYSASVGFVFYPLGRTVLGGSNS